jgi:hypothetical protein
MAMRKFVILACLVGPVTPVLAQTVPQRPESCERKATAQFDNCSTTNIFRCDGEAFQFWTETLDGDGILVIETRNAAHGSMQVYYVGQDTSMEIYQSEAHPRDTIRNGTAEDTIDGTFELFGMRRPVSGRNSYSHDGETVSLADESFARIAFVGSVTLPPPMQEISGRGTFLYSDRLDLLIEEEVRYDFDGIADAYKLARLSLPGQKGFGDETPNVGCGEMSQMMPPATKALA